MIWTLYRLEIFKMVKRLATWVTLICYGILIAFAYGSMYYNSKTSQGLYFGFPDAWGIVLSIGTLLAGIFAAMLLVLLIANEFDWRTSRQNVIDGLSRGQWFTAKLLLLPTLFFIFYTFHVGLSGTLAWLGTRPVTENTVELTNTHLLLAACGSVIGGLCYLAIVFFVSIAIRSAGPALGISIVYLFIESLVTRTLRGMELDRYADLFPIQVQSALYDFNQYYLAGTTRRGWTTISWDTPNLFAAGIGWIIVFVFLSWLVYSKKDL